MRRLKGGKPRRFKDHRRTEAKRWAEDYGTIAEKCKPKLRLERELVAAAADMLGDYKAMRQSKRGTKSAQRKTLGLFLGALRAARNGHAEPEGFDLARQLQAAMRERGAE